MDFAWMAASQACQVTSLTVLVLVLVRLLARNRPHLAHVLWLVVLVKCVTPPLWSSPSGIFSWIQHAAGTAKSSPTVGREVRTHSPVAARVEITANRTANAPPLLAWEGVSRKDSPAARQPATVPRTPAMSFYWSLLVALWIGGVVAALLIHGLRRWHCSVRLRRLPTRDAPVYERLLAELALTLKVSRPVRLMVTTSRMGPAVIGLLRPTVVLPELVIRGKDPQQLVPVLAHELIHVRRGDLWVGLLQVSAQAIWWFYPLVWWVSRLSSREAERCCDEEVIGELGCDARQYARTLLEILQLKRSLEPVAVFPGMKPVEVTSQRLERIMSLGQGCHKRTPRWCWAAMLLLGAAALPGAAFVAAQSESGDSRHAEPTASEAVEGDRTLPLPARDAEIIGPYGSQSGDRSAERAEQAVAPLQLAVYRSSKVIHALQEEFHCNEAQALQVFANLLVLEGQLTNSPLSIPDRVRILNGGVLIAASLDEHDRMHAAVERMEEYGVSRLALEVQFVTVPRRVVEAESWELTPLALGDQISSPLASADTVTQRPLPDGRAQPSARAGLTVTSSLPALYQVLDADESERLIERLRNDPRSQFLQVPRITVLSGQFAKMADWSSRPFVIGVKTVKSDGTFVAEPQIRVIRAGRVAWLRPVLRGNKVWLDYDVTRSDVGDVQVTTVRPAGLQRSFSLQVPTVHTARIESAVEFELGQTVVLGALPANPAGDDDQQLLVIVHAERIRELGDLAYHFVTDEQIPPSFGVPADRPENASQREVYRVVYHVADLVWPRPGIRGGEGQVVADFEPLMDRIQSTVLPESWQDAGGPGAIESFPTNLSLVISQSRMAHEQIADLLEQLRRQGAAIPLPAF